MIQEDRKLKLYEVQQWLDESSIGSKLEYHRGYLFTDRKKSKQLDRTARVLLEAAEEGRVHLFQYRIDDYDYLYLAMKKYFRRT